MEKTILETSTSVSSVESLPFSRHASSVKQTMRTVVGAVQANFNFFVAPLKAKKHIFFSEYLADESWN